MKKIILLLLVAVVIAIATLPLWGGCELQADACSRWCGLRYYDSGIKAAACRAECIGDRVNCIAQKRGATH